MYVDVHVQLTPMLSVDETKYKHDFLKTEMRTAAFALLEAP